MRCEMGMRLVGLVFCVGVLTAPASGRIIYVDGAAEGANDGSSWADAYVHLQDALAEAGPADKPIEIRVAQGLYTPDKGEGVASPTWRASFQLLSGVALKGGYAGVLGVDPDARDLDRYASTLSGESGTSKIVTGDGADATAVLDGFTISPPDRRSAVAAAGGSPTFIDCRFVGPGAEVLSNWPLIDASDCRSVLIGCRFEAGASHGIFCRDGHLTLEDCVFVRNENSAIIGGGALDLVRCSFVDNQGAVHFRGTLIARDCRFVRSGGSRETVEVTGDSTFVDCSFIDNKTEGISPGALSLAGDRATLTRCRFEGNSCSEWGSGAISSYVWVLKLSHCLFVGNRSALNSPGSVKHSGPILQVSNCTFADNRGRPSALKNGEQRGAIAELTQCIVRDGSDPFAGAVSVTYSNVEGGYAGEGNIDVEPAFVAPGHWDANGTPDDPNDDLWITGDYHLKSRAGHWDEEDGSWVLDDITSPCIDLGDPNGPLGAEPFPNGGYVNLGAYGGTAQASRSYFGGPVCETQIAGDINGDCKVDDCDMDILMSHWLMDATARVNVPPTIEIISPIDGAELTPPTPLIFSADAFDPDGTVLLVEYTVEYYDGYHGFKTSNTIKDPSDGWAWPDDWGHLPHDGDYVVRARAIDNDGAIVISDPITITLHPSN